MTSGYAAFRRSKVLSSASAVSSHSRGTRPVFVTLPSCLVSYHVS
jgi:hypothetical protein